MAEKIYAGKGKRRSKTWLQITVDPDVISQHVEEYNGKKFVKLNVNIGEPDKYGKDIQVTVDTWKPESATISTGNESDLPF